MLLDEWVRCLNRGEDVALLYTAKAVFHRDVSPDGEYGTREDTRLLPGIAAATSLRYPHLHHDAEAIT